MYLKHLAQMGGLRLTDIPNMNKLIFNSHLLFVHICITFWFFILICSKILLLSSWTFYFLDELFKCQQFSYSCQRCLFGYACLKQAVFKVQNLFAFKFSDWAVENSLLLVGWSWHMQESHLILLFRDDF